MEEWKSINDYPQYLISNYGNVKNKKERLMKPMSNGNGYTFIRFGRGSKKYYIHRLVGTHFLPNWRNCKEIDHINRNRNDNRFFNLRWATPSEQNKNKNKERNSSSQYKGVDFIKKQNKWRARKDGKHLGVFVTEQEAFLALAEEN